MPSVQAIADYWEDKVPSALKMDFDNVGLLCGYPGKEVTCVLVALDVTTWTIREAQELGAQLILCHHPLIFTPLKHILDTEPTGRRVIALLRGGLSAICLHTNLDVVQGGVNDALAGALGMACTGELSCGRVAELAEPMSMESFAHHVRTALGVSGLRYYDAGRPVKRIALCGGGGGELVGEAAALGCDTLLTGEIKYNYWLDGRENGLNLIDADHFCTENVVVPVLAQMLRKGFPALDVHISRTHSQTSRGV